MNESAECNKGTKQTNKREQNDRPCVAIDIVTAYVADVTIEFCLNVLLTERGNFLGRALISNNNRRTV